jgi:predicted dehydrogenase
MDKMRIGIIGCGNISGAYARFARTFDILDLVGCADIDPARAKATAAEHHIERAYDSVDQLLGDAAIDMVINLTVPAAHAQVSLAAIERGKHVWTEKPLAIDREQGMKVVAAAKARGVRLGGAPDTFFGAGLQTARRVIDEGAIGRVVAATGFMLCPGHASWHPNIEFFYKPGGGPMFDMGPYYLTALLNLIGSIRSIHAVASITQPTQRIQVGDRAGETITVETPDHVAAHLTFDSGAIAMLITSFATHHPIYDRKHPIVIYGTQGTMQVPDPNTFDLPVLIRAAADEQWTEVPFEHRTGYGRSVGAADMAHALRGNRPHRASAEQIACVLDAMQGCLDSAASGRAYDMRRDYERPAPLPTGLAPGVLDD